MNKKQQQWNLMVMWRKPITAVRKVSSQPKSTITTTMGYHHAYKTRCTTRFRNDTKRWNTNDSLLDYHCKGIQQNINLLGQWQTANKDQLTNDDYYYNSNYDANYYHHLQAIDSSNTLCIFYVKCIS